MSHVGPSRFTPRRLARHVILAAWLALLAPAPTAFAAALTTQALNPAPPAFLNCQPVGNGTICHGARALPFGPIDLNDEGGPAFTCGSGASAFHILDSATLDQDVVRYYDRDGNLTRRVIHELWRSAQFTNSLTGAAVSYTQRDTIVDVLAVPGDFNTATTTITGNQTNVTVPHQGTIFLQGGRSVFAADGTLDFEAGPDAANDYFVDGDTSVWQPVCDALEAG